jgi:hypothetical protein
MHRHSPRRVAFAFALLSLSLSLPSCATIAGTAVSPVTGGVDLCREFVPKEQWYWMPFAFLGGAVAGPFVALYNGVNYDAKGVYGYWASFSDVFRPFHLLRNEGHRR